jgi:hypothetical protein
MSKGISARRSLARVLAGALALTWMGAKPAVYAQQTQTITVTTTAKVIDFPAPQQAANLPGPDGKVSPWEAVIAANNTPGGQLIHFNIPTSDPGYVAALNQFELEPPVEWEEQFIFTDNGTVFDGSTQPGGALIAMRGTPAVTVYSAARVESDFNTIRGFFFTYLKYGIEVTGSSNVIAGNYLTQNFQAGLYVTGANNTIGGELVADRNFVNGNSGSGIVVTGETATGNTLVNNYVGITSDGVSGYGNHSTGISVGGAHNTVGGIHPNLRNVVAGNGHTSSGRSPVGSQVAIGGGDNRVLGNYIGLNAIGNGHGSVASSGLSVTGTNHVIGGPNPGEGNYISSTNYYSQSIASRPAGVRVTVAIGPNNVPLPTENVKETTA